MSAREGGSWRTQTQLPITISTCSVSATGGAVKGTWSTSSWDASYWIYWMVGKNAETPRYQYTSHTSPGSAVTIASGYQAGDTGVAQMEIRDSFGDLVARGNLLTWSL